MFERRSWREALLWLPDRRLLVCAETLGTADFDLARSGDRLGMHPLARLHPPRAAFAGLDPPVIAVGHGPPLDHDATESMRNVLRRARRQLPQTGCGWCRRRSERRELRGELVPDRQQRRPHVRLGSARRGFAAPTSGPR